MTAGAVMIVAAAASASWVSIQPRPPEVSGEVVRLGEVADLSGAPANIRVKAADLVLTRLAPGSEATIHGSQLVAKLTALMPALRDRIAAPDEIYVHRTRAGIERDLRTSSCALVSRAISIAEVLTKDDLVPADCTADAVVTPLRYDGASRVIRAQRPLAQGDLISAPPPQLLADAPAGQQLEVQVDVGPVSIGRVVQTVQPRRSGRAVAVRGEKGSAFRAPSPEAPR